MGGRGDRREEQTTIATLTRNEDPSANIQARTIKGGGEGEEASGGLPVVNSSTCPGTLKGGRGGGGEHGTHRGSLQYAVGLV